MLKGSRFTFARDAATLKKGMEPLAGLPVIVVDSETEGLDPLTHRVLLIQLGTDAFQLLVDCTRVDPAPLAAILAGPQVKVFQNGKFDLKMLEAWFGLGVRNAADTMLIEQILGNTLRGSDRVERVGLQFLARKYLGIELDKTEQKSFLTSGPEFSDAQIEYARTDVAATYRIFLRQMEQLQKEQLEETARIECAALPAYARMELKGMHLDTARWRAAVAQNDAELREKRTALLACCEEAVVEDLFGEPGSDWGSDEQIKAICKKAGYAPRDLRKETLATERDPRAKIIMEFREARGHKAAHGLEFLRFVHAADGRVHADFNQIAANSGRSSCADPNLQGIPKTARYRSCFAAPAGRKIVTADYAGAELRIIAEASEDPIFIRTFKQGGDLHSIVAQAVFGKKVTKDENADLRAKAKVINFGLAYGMGPAALAVQTGYSIKEAERLLASYFKSFPTIYHFLESTSREALNRGCCITLGGRRCRLPEARSLSPQAEQEVLRFAKNMPIQGTNADIVKAAMARIDEGFETAGIDAFIVHMVHDELVAEVPADRAKEAALLVKEQMVAAGAWFIKRLPVEVECHIGDYWGHKGEAV